MLDLKACTVCFKTDGNMNKIDSGQLERLFYIVSSVKASERVGFPQYLCVECTAYVHRFTNFRDKCKRAHFALKEIKKRNVEITLHHIKTFDRILINNMPTLSYVNIKNMHYENAKFQWVANDRINFPEEHEIPIVYYSTLVDNIEYNVAAKKQRLSNEYDVQLVKLENESELNIEMMLEKAETENENDLEDGHYFFDNNELSSDGDDNIEEKINKLLSKKQADGVSFNKDYATAIPLTENEAKAVNSINRKYYTGKLGPYFCGICSKGYYNETRYNIHLRMHDRHISGNFHCTYCDFYYKTDFLLKTHMNNKHNFKYLCKACPEVNYSRAAAKKHYVFTHNGDKKKSKTVKKKKKLKPNRNENGVKMHHVRNLNLLPADFLKYSPVTHEQQYAIVEQRKLSRNYLEAQFKCELCYRGFREVETYSKHMKKHDPELCGQIQCDICKLYFPDTRKLYRHMNRTHLFQYSCQMCSYVCYGRGQARLHYRWHKDITYRCSHCDKEFKKASTHLTHVRLKHPSTFICAICGHSYVSDAGLYCHKKLTHTAEEIERSDTSEVDPKDPNYCAECKVQFVTTEAFATHLGTSNKHAAINLVKSTVPKRKSRASQNRGRPPGRPRHGSSEIVNTGVPTSTHCEVCGKYLSNDVQARKHYDSEHPGTEMMKRYMCDVCGHTTRQYANLLVHMRTHTNEKPFDCPYCDRKFSMPSNRDRHLVVHTGEKRYQCHHCNRRFTQSSAVKLHIQTVHLKIPYAPWDKKARKRRKEFENLSLPSSSVVPTTLIAPQPKLLLDPQGDYLNAYITYNDE